jgi:hypothetical protein
LGAPAAPMTWPNTLNLFRDFRGGCRNFNYDSLDALIRPQLCTVVDASTGTLAELT